MMLNFKKSLHYLTGNLSARVTPKSQYLKSFDSTNRRATVAEGDTTEKEAKESLRSMRFDQGREDSLDKILFNYLCDRENAIEPNKGRPGTAKWIWAQQETHGPGIISADGPTNPRVEETTRLLAGHNQKKAPQHREE